MVCRDASHAALVNGTLAQQAGAARHRLADDAGESPQGSSRHGIGGTEDGQDRGAHRGRDVHGAGVVADQQAYALQNTHQCQEIRAPTQIHRRPAHPGGHLVQDRAFSFRSDEEDPRPTRLHQPIRHRGKSIGRPALGAPVDRSRVQRHEEVVGRDPMLSQELVTLPPSLVAHWEAEDRRPIAAKRPHDGKIPLHLMSSRRRRLFRHRMGKQPAPTVPGIADPTWNSGQPGGQRCIQRVRKHHRQIEPPFPQFPGQAPAPAKPPMGILGPVLDDPIHGRVPREEPADPGPCQQRDLGLGESAIEGLQGREREDRIPDPVHLPHQDPPDVLRIKVNHSRAISSDEQERITDGGHEAQRPLPVTWAASCCRGGL